MEKLSMIVPGCNYNNDGFQDSITIYKRIIAGDFDEPYQVGIDDVTGGICPNICFGYETNGILSELERCAGYNNCLGDAIEEITGFNTHQCMLCVSAKSVSPANETNRNLDSYEHFNCKHCLWQFKNKVISKELVGIDELLYDYDDDVHPCLNTKSHLLLRTRFSKIDIPWGDFDEKLKMIKTVLKDRVMLMESILEVFNKLMEKSKENQE